jgi:hypothetical protein
MPVTCDFQASLNTGMASVLMSSTNPGQKAQAREKAR